MKCLFCSQEMEDEEKLVDFHICLPEVQNMSLRPEGVERFGYVTYGDVCTIMDEIVDSDEEDGWEAFSILREKLAEKCALPHRWNCPKGDCRSIKDTYEFCPECGTPRP